MLVVAAEGVKAKTERVALLSLDVGIRQASFQCPAELLNASQADGWNHEIPSG